MSLLICMFFLCEVSEMEESMLSALRPPEHTTATPCYTSASTSAAHIRLSTDPSELPPDRLHVEMEMSPDSQIILYGPLLRALISIKVRESLMNVCNQDLTRKMNQFNSSINYLFLSWSDSDAILPLLWQENYFGEYDMYTDFEEVVSSPVLSTSTSSGLGWSPLGVEDGERKDASDFHPLDLRPWDITVYINLYKVHGRLPMVNHDRGFKRERWML